MTLAAAPGELDGERLANLWSYKVWALYEGRPYWCGVPTGISDDGGSYVTITMTELTGYLAKRQWDVYPGARYVQAEQTAIAADIAAPLADVGVGIVASAGPGYLRDRSYEYLEGESRGALLSNLSGVIGGPEFRTEYGMSPGGLPVCTLRIAYPRVGGQTHLALAAPGDALGYRVAWDADQLRTRTFAVGELPESAEEGTPRPVVTVDQPRPDLPRLDMADDWPGTQLESTLRERALTAAAQYAVPVIDLSATAGLVPNPGLYGVGDDVTVRLVTPLIQDGLDADGRLTEITVSAGESTASWSVVFALPSPRPRETAARRLDRLDYQLRGQFRHRVAPV
jgi:hypothetical protein